MILDPLFLLAKAKPELELWNVASYKKRAPRYVTTDPDKISSILQLIDTKKLRVTLFSHHSLSKILQIKEDDLYSYEADDLRAVFMHMGARLKKSLLAVEHQHQKMSALAQNVGFPFLTNAFIRLQDCKCYVEGLRKLKIVMKVEL